MQYDTVLHLVILSFSNHLSQLLDPIYDSLETQLVLFKCSCIVEL